jgi:hypothetical protein
LSPSEYLCLNPFWRVTIPFPSESSVMLSIITSYNSSPSLSMTMNSDELFCFFARPPKSLKILPNNPF